MRILITTHHPAQVYQFRDLIYSLRKYGYEILVLITNKDNEAYLLNKFGIQYMVLTEFTGKGFIGKLLYFFIITLKIFNRCIKFKPDYLISRASPMLAVNAFIFNKPHLVFEDTEIARINLFFCRIFSKIIFTPQSFKLNLGNKQKRIPTFKELSYLGPKKFTPDFSVLEKAGYQKTDNFIVLRFVAWNASHDFGNKGIVDDFKLKMVDSLSKYAKVYISSENPLPPELEKYKLIADPENIHHFLYFAQLLIGESGTMATEASLLGTMSINIATSATRIGVFEELEKSGLMKVIPNNTEALNTALNLLQNPKPKSYYKEISTNIINTKVDANDIILDYIRKGQ